MSKPVKPKAQSTTPNTKISTKARLLSAAATLFYNHGIGATGIDAIIAEAGVAKQSLYNHFASKSELIAAYIQARHQEWLVLYAVRVQSARTPKDKILAVFDAYQDHAEFAYTHGFRGCGLLNAAAELPAGDLGRAAVRAHKDEVQAILQAHLAEHMGLSSDDALPHARHLAYLLEGAITRAGLEGDSGCLIQARQIADGILGRAEF